jgi:hypothetical protein
VELQSKAIEENGSSKSLVIQYTTSLDKTNFFVLQYSYMFWLIIKASSGCPDKNVWRNIM